MVVERSSSAVLLGNVADLQCCCGSPTAFGTRTSRAGAPVRRGPFGDTDEAAVGSLARNIRGRAAVIVDADRQLVPGNFEVHIDLCGSLGVTQCIGQRSQMLLAKAV